MSKYEIAYISSENEIRSKLYDSRDKFITDFNIISKSGKPCMAQGPDKTGKIVVVEKNGWNNDDVILTAVVNFGSGKKYSYSASRHYSGMYEVLSRGETVLVSVSYAWRQIDEFRASLWEKGYDNPTAFESILVRKAAK